MFLILQKKQSGCGKVIAGNGGTEREIQQSTIGIFFIKRLKLRKNKAPPAMAEKEDAASDRDWSILPEDVLRLIENFLELADFLSLVRLPAVCKAWALALGREPRPCRGLVGFPWLLLASDDGETSGSCLFRIFPEQRDINFSFLPEIRGRRWMGSKDGWLATLDPSLQPRLLNPLTHSQVTLPSLLTVPDNLKALHASDGSIEMFVCDYFSGRHHGLKHYPAKNFRDRYVRKIILSTPPFGVVVAILGLHCSIAMTKPGDEAWSLVGSLNGFHGYVEDVVYHDEDQLFYAVTGYLKVFSFDLSGSVIQWFAVSRGRPERHINYKYIVFSSSQDQLLLIERYVTCWWNDDDDTQSEETSEFRIFKLELQKQRCNGSMLEVVELRDLGDESLFLGCNTSKSFSASGVPGMRHNCIYYTQDRWHYGPPAITSAFDVGVFDGVSNSFERRFNGSFQINWPPPIWFVPSIR